MFDLLLDQLDHLLRPGQAGKGGELDLLVLGELHHVLLVDDDDRADEFPLVADDDRVVDVGRELQQVLDVLRGDVLPAGGDDQVLLPVGDLEEPLRIDLAHVPGVHPAVVERLPGRLFILVVSLEDPLVADEDLAVLGDPHLRLGKGLPTVPSLKWFSSDMWVIPVVSVIPYPSRIGIPMLWKYLRML